MALVEVHCPAWGSHDLYTKGLFFITLPTAHASVTESSMSHSHIRTAAKTYGCNDARARHIQWTGTTAKHGRAAWFFWKQAFRSQPVARLKWNCISILTQGPKRDAMTYLLWLMTLGRPQTCGVRWGWGGHALEMHNMVEPTFRNY